MLLTSYSFIFFLIIVFFLYFAVPKKLQWKLLLGASLVFYYFSGWSNLVYILVTILSTYFISLKINNLGHKQDVYLKENKEQLSKDEKKEYKAKVKSKQWKLLLLCLFFNFGVLAVLKYTNFTITNINSVLASFSLGRLSLIDLVLPLGISFYTFQTMGYIIDVYRGKYPPERNIGRLALFVSFFPQLIQGPISRFDDLSQSLFDEHKFDFTSFSFGVQRILWGFFKKLVIADRIAVGVNAIIKNPDQYDGVFYLVGIIFYAIQIYADFTGGIDITIGIAQALGIKVKENFQRPFFSKNIVEYWRRWHITLAEWFRDYLFYPISVCKPMLNISKFSRTHFGDEVGKRIPVYLSTIAVWFTTGLWHGANWNFIVWGLLNGAIILASKECEPLYEKFHKRFHVGHTFWYRLFQVARTFLLMSALRSLDCYRNVGLTFKMFFSMFTKFNFDKLFDGSMLGLGLTVSDYIVLAAGVALLTATSLIQRSGSIRARLSAKPEVLRYSVYVLLFFMILIFGAYGIGYDSSQFIYNQF